MKEIDINNDTFGRRLCKSRKDIGLSQKKLSELLGYKRHTTIYNLEADKATPDLAALAKIADILKVDLHWLITGQKTPDAIKVLQKLAKYISHGISQVLDERDEADTFIQELEQKQASGKLSEEEFSDLVYWKRQREHIQRQLNDFIEDQPWVKEALETATNTREIKKNISAIDPD